LGASPEISYHTVLGNMVSSIRKVKESIDSNETVVKIVSIIISMLDHEVKVKYTVFHVKKYDFHRKVGNFSSMNGGFIRIFNI
jgi:hypothetical protein